MDFWFSLGLSNIDLWNTDLLDTHSDLLDTDIPSKHFVCLHNVFKTSLRHVFKTSWRSLQLKNFSSSKKSWRRLQDILKTSWKTKNRHAEDVLKTSSRRLQDEQLFTGYIVEQFKLRPAEIGLKQLYSFDQKKVSCLSNYLLLIHKKSR